MTPDEIAELRRTWDPDIVGGTVAREVNRLLDEIERLRDPLENVLGLTLDERQARYTNWKEFAALLRDEPNSDIVLGESRLYLGVALVMALNEIERLRRIATEALDEFDETYPYAGDYLVDAETSARLQAELAQ